ncbi:MAG: AAA family ATPase [Chloroflexaceae bacterium]|nr:AAA family ATPase [Chloroflexaceae bacterium]
MRHALPNADHLLHIDAKVIQWQPVLPYVLDVAEFEQAIQQADQAVLLKNQEQERAALERAVSCYTGDLLPTCYDEWILPERDSLTRQFMQILERMIRLLLAQQAYRQALPYAQRLVRVDPLHEGVYRYLMEGHARNGDRGRALRVYHTCATTLQRELGVPPDAATRSLYAQLTSSDNAGVLSAGRPFNGVGETPLIGRQAEYAWFQHAWQQAASGHAQLALVIGEAGVGKTRLIEEVLVWSRQTGITSARARCYAAEGRLAYAPVVDWLRNERLWTLLSRLQTIWLSELTRLLPEICNDYPHVPVPESQLEVWERQRLFEALARAILIGAQPLLLVIDDLQWCDRETIAWVRYLLRFAPVSHESEYQADQSTFGSCFDIDCPVPDDVIFLDQEQ